MKRLSEILPGALGKPEVLRAARAMRALRRWDAVVGATLAAKTTPDRFDHGVVWVSAAGSAWAQELRMRREAVLAKLNVLAGEPSLFRDMRVCVGPVQPEPSPHAARVL
jgi:predicted nucleic acid-binding Zn ribbon protein